MTAHIVFAAIDDTAPATFSRRLIDTIIRGEIGFDGVLLSDDISMRALDGTLAERARRALDAGCDLALHCSGVMDEMVEIFDAARPITPVTRTRIAGAEKLRRGRQEAFDRRAAERRFDELMAGAGGTGTSGVRSRP
jgi:beta-N-acetylhexosaminidase